MANRYDYGTSPRKIETEEKPIKKHKNRNIRIVEDLPRQEVRISEEKIKKQKILTLIVIAIFMLLLTISYRNSQINEKFALIQSQKKELTSIEKENEQLKVNIENAVNLNNIEKQAKEKLGMQKLINSQSIYVSLPKKDYVESVNDEIMIEEEKNWIEKLLDKIK